MDGKGVGSGLAAISPHFCRSDRYLTNPKTNVRALLLLFQLGERTGSF